MGAGPAGLAAAWQLARRGFNVTVAERGDSVGGLAGSFDFAGQRVDYGSHRLHPSCEPAILTDIRGWLGEDLLDRPRHGRILLHGRWLHFPLQTGDILRHAPRRFAAGVVRDLLWKPAVAGDPESFASVLRRGLGPTVCSEFYFPYARKIWGVEPAELDAEQARRRVSAGSFKKLIQKVTSPAGRRRFFYPRRGFGQISEAYAAAARRAGAKILLRSPVVAIAPGQALLNTPAGEMRMDPGLILSTIPVTALARLVGHEPGRLQYRAMILVYLALDRERFTEFDAHYFPSEEIPITRLSEPRHYSLNAPSGSTVVCAELPCAPEDDVWQANDEALRDRVLRSLHLAGIPYGGRVRDVAVRRLREAYPIYCRGYREHFDALDAWASSLPGVVSFGRQGLFAHDNTHHTLAMAYAAARCVADDGSFLRDAWSEARKTFEAFVVED